MAGISRITTDDVSDVTVMRELEKMKKLLIEALRNYDNIEEFKVTKDEENSITLGILTNLGAKYEATIPKDGIKDVAVGETEFTKTVTISTVDGKSWDFTIPKGGKITDFKITKDTPNETEITLFADSDSWSVSIAKTLIPNDLVYTDKDQVIVSQKICTGDFIFRTTRTENAEAQKITVMANETGWQGVVAKGVRNGVEVSKFDPDQGCEITFEEGVVVSDPYTESDDTSTKDGMIKSLVIGKIDKSALDEEITKRTEADTGLSEAITQEETARKSADDGIYGRIAELNKDLDDETTAREEADALKEDKANKVTAWSETPSDDKYPSEKLVKEKCFDINYQLTETEEYMFAEHRLGNGIVLIEGFIKTFSLAGASGRTFDLYFKNNMDMLKIAPISHSASGYADISYAMTELASENRIKFEMYNSGSGNVDVGPSFIGFGRVNNG